MTKSKFILILLICPAFLFGQKKTFEIFGSISGEYKEKIYLFFENNSAQKDSLYSTIKNGKFYFKTSSDLPILCRFHFGANTNVQELYIDNSKTFINFSSKLTEKDIPDSLGGPRTNFELLSVKGSTTENIIRSFQTWNLELQKANQTEEQKHTMFVKKLKSIVVRYPKSKASAYLIAGRIMIVGKHFLFYDANFPLKYSEISALTGLLDKSLVPTLEYKNLSKLLNKINLDRHRTIGDDFKNSSLKDTSNNDIDTKLYKSKYTLIDFWASWCKPCRSLNPEIKILYQKYKDKGLEIIGISIDENKEEWKRAIVQDGLQWPQLNDNKGEQGFHYKYYDINGVPFEMLLDENSKIIGFNLSTDEVENIIKKKL